MQSEIDNWTDDEITMLSVWSTDELVPMVVTKRREALLNYALMRAPFRLHRESNIVATILEQRPASWWLDWTLELISGNNSSRILAINLSNRLRENTAFANAVIAELNRANSETFKPLLYFIVPDLKISSDQIEEKILTKLTDEMLDFRSMMGEPIIGLLASEEFAQSVLTPMWKRAAPNSERRRVLELALNAAGKRHNRRYAI